MPSLLYGAFYMIQLRVPEDKSPMEIWGADEHPSVGQSTLCQVGSRWDSSQGCQ